MKSYAMHKIGESGWIEKERPVCGPMDAICKPLAIAICTSAVHTLWEGAIGNRHNMILGHEGCAEVVEVGSMVKDFKHGGRLRMEKLGAYGDICRAKGFLRAGGQNLRFDVADGRYNVTGMEDMKEARVVFIGKELARQKLRKQLLPLMKMRVARGVGKKPV